MARLPPSAQENTKPALRLVRPIFSFDHRRTPERAGMHPPSLVSSFSFRTDVPDDVYGVDTKPPRCRRPCCGALCCALCESTLPIASYPHLATMGHYGLSVMYVCTYIRMYMHNGGRAMHDSSRALRRGNGLAFDRAAACGLAPFAQICHAHASPQPS